MNGPVLIACSHGTNSGPGKAAIQTIVRDAGMLLPGVRIVQAFVDVESPRIDEVVLSETRDADAIIVPMLLSAGYHTRVDIARAARLSDRASVTPPLGSHPLVADLVTRRLREAGATRGDAVVLAAAGSSDPAAAVDVGVVAESVSRLWGAPVAAGYAASAQPLLADALATARSTGRRTVGASYVLAPGHFAGVITSTGFDVVTEPLGPDQSLAIAVADRYRAALRLPALSAARA